MNLRSRLSEHVGGSMAFIMQTQKPKFSFCGGKTARWVVSGLSQGLQAKSGFSELGAVT